MNDDLDAMFADTERRWYCVSCAMDCPWWRGSDRFPLCVKCAAAKGNPPLQLPLMSAEPELKYVHGAIHAGRPDEVRSTDKAVLFTWDGRVSVWVPRSVIKQDNADGLHVVAWFAKKQLLEVLK